MLSMMRSSPSCQGFGTAGREPVATMQFLNRTVPRSSPPGPVTPTELASANVAWPRSVSTVRPLHSCAIPPVSLPTTLVCT